MPDGSGPFGETAAAAVSEEGIMAGGSSKDLVAGCGGPVKGSSTKRKAEVVPAPTGEKGPLEGGATKRKAEELAGGCLLGDMTADAKVAAAGGDGKAPPVAAAGDDGKATPAADSEEEDEEEEDFWASLSPEVLEILNAKIDIPGLVISNDPADFYEGWSDEEDGESDDEEDVGKYDDDEEDQENDEDQEEREIDDEALVAN